MKAKVIKTGEIVDVYHEPQHGQIINIYKESVLINGRMWSEDELDFCVKANEAPEKIYINSNFENRTWLIGKGDISFIEYIRADVFIEKACNYLMEYEFNDSPTIVDRRKRVDKFRNYIKEELIEDL